MEYEIVDNKISKKETYNLESIEISKINIKDLNNNFRNYMLLGGCFFFIFLIIFFTFINL